MDRQTDRGKEIKNGEARITVERYATPVEGSTVCVRPNLQPPPSTSTSTTSSTSSMLCDHRKAETETETETESEK